MTAQFPRWLSFSCGLSLCDVRAFQRGNVVGRRRQRCASVDAVLRLFERKRAKSPCITMGFCNLGGYSAAGCSAGDASC